MFLDKFQNELVCFVPLVRYLGVGLLGHMVMACLTRKEQNVNLKPLLHFIFSPVMHENSNVSTSSPTLVTIHFIYESYLSGCDLVVHCVVSICILNNLTMLKSFFHFLVGHLYIIFWRNINSDPFPLKKMDFLPIYCCVARLLHIFLPDT